MTLMIYKSLNEQVSGCFPLLLGALCLLCTGGPLYSEILKLMVYSYPFVSYLLASSLCRI